MRMETRFVLIIFIFQVIKKTSALALSASLEVTSASLLIIPIQAEALPERGYMLFVVNKNYAQNPVKLFLSLCAFIRKLSELTVYANADANAYANADANAMHVIVIVIAIVIVIVIAIANSLCSSKDE